LLSPEIVVERKMVHLLNIEPKLNPTFNFGSHSLEKSSFTLLYLRVGFSKNWGNSCPAYHSK
jgi:hypothetical protein